jgi:rRNA maturation protein Nop10
MTTIMCDTCKKTYKTQMICKACGGSMNIQPPTGETGSLSWLIFHCESCGKKYKAKPKCQFCGGSVSFAAPEQPAAIAASHAEAPQHEQLILDDDGSTTAAHPKSNKRSRKLPILIAAAIVVVLAAVAFAFWGWPLIKGASSR